MLGGAYGVMGSESAADLSSPEGGRNTSLGGVAMPQGRMFESKKKRSQEVSRAEKSGSNLIAPFLCEVAEDEKEDALNDTLRASLAKNGA